MHSERGEEEEEVIVLLIICQFIIYICDKKEENYCTNMHKHYIQDH